MFDRVFVAVMTTIFSSFALGCGSTSLTRAGAAQSPHSPDCEYQIYTTSPNSPFIEVGTIDVSPGYAGVNWTSDLGSFKQKIRSQVCEAGGDAAIALANGDGLYVKATVLKMNEGSPLPTTVPGSSEHGVPGGCQYDTQCKGDRICVAGECKSPSPPNTPE